MTSEHPTNKNKTGIALGLASVSVYVRSARAPGLVCTVCSHNIVFYRVRAGAGVGQQCEIKVDAYLHVRGYNFALAAIAYLRL